MNTNEEIYSDIYYAPTKIIFGGKIKTDFFNRKIYQLEISIRYLWITTVC